MPTVSQLRKQAERDRVSKSHSQRRGRAGSPVWLLFPQPLSLNSWLCVQSAVRGAEHVGDDHPDS